MKGRSRQFYKQHYTAIQKQKRDNPTEHAGDFNIIKNPRNEGYDAAKVKQYQADKDAAIKRFKEDKHQQEKIKKMIARIDKQKKASGTTASAQAGRRKHAKQHAAHHTHNHNANGGQGNAAQQNKPIRQSLLGP